MYDVGDRVINARGTLLGVVTNNVAGKLTIENSLNEYMFTIKETRVHKLINRRKIKFTKPRLLARHWESDEAPVKLSGHVDDYVYKAGDEITIDDVDYIFIRRIDARQIFVGCRHRKSKPGKIKRINFKQ